MPPPTAPRQGRPPDFCEQQQIDVGIPPRGVPPPTSPPVRLREGPAGRVPSAGSVRAISRLPLGGSAGLACRWSTSRCDDRANSLDDPPCRGPVWSRDTRHSEVFGCRWFARRPRHLATAPRTTSEVARPVADVKRDERLSVPQGAAVPKRRSRCLTSSPRPRSRLGRSGRSPDIGEPDFP